MTAAPHVYPSRADCPCCRHLGALPGPWVVDVLGRPNGQAVPGDVLVLLCEACLTAVAFGTPHPHSIAGLRRAWREHIKAAGGDAR